MSSHTITQTTYQQQLADGKLMASHCPACNASYLPPRPMCPQCFGAQMEWREMPTHGKLAAFTVVHIAPTAMIEAGYGRDNPYCSGIVELENGLKISAQITGVDVSQPELIQIGSAVQAEFLQREAGAFLAFEVIE
ncbi:MAG: Zn-ribbon domain-containing OB-fold protein [Anaerolineae bacterium]|nr:Zn-ribbon domain-containing OB-fold protein [Anaerolineae bacterium]MBL6966484.1 Zn-ribbon domain-containing OB-fold protein [Anaerolineales bacterium]